jgi:hypothetical protein
MKIALTVRNGEETRGFKAIGSSYESVRHNVLDLVPEGWQPLYFRV